MIRSSSNNSFSGMAISSRRLLLRLTVVVMLILFLFPSPGTMPVSTNSHSEVTQQNIGTGVWAESGNPYYESTGAAQLVTLNGAISNDSQQPLLIDSSTPAPVSINAPQGWTGKSLTGTMEQVSTWFTPIENGLLDNYHSERTIIAGSPWNAMDYNVPDDWNIMEEGDSIIHPYYGRLFFHSYSGTGRDGSMGWRFNSVYSTSNNIDPNMKLYLRQHVDVPYRELYSAEISLYYYVRSQSTLNDYFYLFVRFGDFEAKLHLFESGDPTDQWLQYTIQVPMSAFDSYPIPGALDIDIGIGTDYSGTPASNVDNQLLIDQVDLVLEARPFPEQIGLSANQTLITSSVPGSVSPYVPDGASRDCFSRSDTGISTSSALEVGIWSSSGTAWDDVIKYQIGIQFPLDIPQGAIITSASLEVEALGYFGGGDNGLRLFVAEEDNVSPFTNGLPTLENRYSWSTISSAWIQDSWENGYRYRTPDMSSLVQSVVSRSGWNSGNYICLMIDYMNSDLYRDWNSIKGTWGYNGVDLSTLYVDFMVPQENDTISLLNYKKDLTIDHTKVSSDLEDFPVLVDIYDSDLKTDCQSDGDDIKFMLGSETLDYELEEFDQNFNSSHAHLTAWVRVPNISSSADTVISMSYGSESASRTEDAARVWGDLYESVWHFSESDGNGSYIEDSAGRTHDALPMSTTYLQSGVINSGRQFQDAVGNYMPVIEGDELFDGWSDWYLSFWLYIDYASDAEMEVIEPRVLYKGTSMWGARLWRNVGFPAGEAQFQVDVNFFTTTTRYHNVAVRRLEWNYIVMKYESSGDGALHLYNYINGALYDSGVDASVGTGDRLEDDSSDFTLGDASSSSISGIYDEFRLASGSYRSMAWIETEYANQYDPSSFLSVGTEQSVQYGQNATLLFTTDAPSVVSILPRMTLNVTTQETTLDANMNPGTSFSVTNGTGVTWTANVLVNPPLGVADTNLTLEKLSTWTLQSVSDSLGNVRTSEVTATATQVMVPSTVIDVNGVWSFSFTSTNEASNLECAAGVSPYGMTAIVQSGQTIDFRGTASIIPGSAMRLTLVDPNDQIFYASDDLSQDGSGQFEWNGIAVDGSWLRGLWTAHVDFNDTAGAFPLYIGRYSREFVVKHGSSLELQSPGDAVGDQLSVKTAGDLLLVEVHLTDTNTSESMADSTVTMNWTLSGAPTQVQLEDYGDGSYGAALNTSDLGLPGMWRINILSNHPYLVDSTTYFDLELSHPTYILYETPETTAYGDDFIVKINLYDAINSNPYASATITSNGTLAGVPVDYGNGTYLVQIDSGGLEPGVYGFQIGATPSQSFVLGSTTDVVFTYRDINAQLIQIGDSPISIPWGQTVNTTLEWQDSDHGAAGITGGSLSGDATFQYTDLLDGTYSVQIDVSDYAVGVYLFNFTISKSYYFPEQITIAVSVVPHRTAIVATYNSSVPLGSNTYISLVFYDLDLSSTQIPSNFSSVLAQWSGDSSVYGSKNFWLQTQGWSLGSHVLNLTLYATTSPRYYSDAKTAVIIEIRKVSTYLDWDPIDSFPVGDDFQITLYLNVSEFGSLYDGDPIDGLDVSYFDAQDKDGSPYTIKDLSFLGGGSYLLTINQSFFSINNYTIRIYITFGGSENYTSTQSPIINFVYSEARSELTSPDYPTMTISYSTNAAITLEFIDIDRGQGIDTATVAVTGATEISEDWISSGRYRVVIDTSSLSIGVYNVNLTVSAPGYQNKTISIDIQIREIKTFAIATVGLLDIPIGDSQVFYVDYIDMDHDIAIFPATGTCNWTLSHYDIIWTGIRWKVTITTYDTDSLGSYLLMFNYTAGSEYMAAYFNVSVQIRTIDTELRLVTPAETTTATGQIQVSVYYGDRDHVTGIVSSDVSCTVRNSTGILSITWVNGTSAGYYDITIEASQFGSLGTQQLTIIFNWTGSVQKYQDKFILTTAEIVGEESQLILIDTTPATPCLGYMNYTFLYSSASSGLGITNDTFDVFIRVEFIGISVDLSQITIWEINSVIDPGYYSIGFNNTILGSIGLFSMKVFINWSQDASPFYTNRTDVISVRILPRDTLLSIVPPTSVPYGENATFSFTYEDITGGTSSTIENDAALTVALSLADFSLYYDSMDSIFTVSFNTSQFGPPLGERTFTLSLTWSGIPFYANKTGQLVSVTVVDRQIVLTYPTPPSTSYGDNVSFTIVITDVAGSTSKGVESVSISLYDGVTEIPQNYLSVSDLGQGQYLIELNTSYYSLPGEYDLGIVASPVAFYYLSKSDSRTLAVNSRQTLLIAQPPGSVAYNTTLSIVLQYLDLNTLNPIANESGLATAIEILNGSSWTFTCVWRQSMQNYLLTVDTYNQPLNIGIPYLLWLNFSTEDQAPFYRWADALVQFQLRERDTSLDLISAALPTQYLDLANFTIEYKDVLSLSGIAGGTMILYNGTILLNESIDYYITSSGVGRYSISIVTSVLGAPGIKTVTVIADWPGGAPYYNDTSRDVTISVTERQTSIEIIVPPSETHFLENVTFDFIFKDITTGQAIGIIADDIRLYNDGVLLSPQDYVVSVMGSVLQVSLNSTIISGTLVSGWNITVVVDWTGGAPFYTNKQSTVYVTTVSRTGTVVLNQVLETPLGDNVTLGLTFYDQAKGVGIEGASITLNCVEIPGLVENTDFWVLAGTGPEAGEYTIEVNSSALGGLGLYTFTLEVRWNPLISPYYSNVTNLLSEAFVRTIQVSLSSELPTPSVAAFYQNISFTISFEDIDHPQGIDNAVGSISLRYGSTGSEPSIWSVNAISNGVYNITLNLTDTLTTGLQYIIINITLYPYHSIETQAVFGVRNRVGGLSADIPPANYAGEPTYITVNITDDDAGGTPLSGATLTLGWGDFASYIDLGDGRYNVTLFTSNLGFGVQTLTIDTSLTYFSINTLNVEIELLAVTSELIVTWTGPRPYSQQEIYWGEPLTIYAAFNDTLRNQLVTSATVVYIWTGGTDVFGLTGMPGNFTASIDTSQGNALDTVIVTIEGQAPNYLNASAQVSFQLLPRPTDVIPEESRYTFSVDWGGQASVVVYLQDSESGGLVPDANLTASWALANLTLSDVPGRPGFYSVNIPTINATFGNYEIQVYAFKENFRNASVTLTMIVSKINMVLWLDSLTQSYEYTPIYWSDMIRIGVYVLAPALNSLDPYDTGLSNCVVRWFSPELGMNGTLLNGTLIGGSGYYYFDFNTTESTASVHTFELSAEPPSSDYTDAENSTMVLIQNLPASVLSPGSPELVWGWTGYINFTYLDNYHGVGIEADKASFQWAGGSEDAYYLGNGTYGVPFNTSTVRPGLYRVTISFQKINYNDLLLTIAVNIIPVPTEVVVNLPEEYRVGETWTQLQVPYGDMLNIIAFYNDTWNNIGITGANSTGSFFSGPGFFEDTIEFVELENGNYSFVFDTQQWDLFSEFSFKVLLALENRTTGILFFEITIIDIPTRIELQGPGVLSLFYGQNITIWIVYSDAWPSHSDRGITDAEITINNNATLYATLEYVGQDSSRPGYYEFRLFAQRIPGHAEIEIVFNKTYYVVKTVGLIVSINPSEFDIMMENVMVVGSVFAIIFLLSGIIWVRVINVPKLVRALRSQIRQLRRGRVPKPARDVKTRQEILAELFNEFWGPLGVSRKAEALPSESVIVDVPEIEHLLVDLIILTDMSQEETDEFKLELTKMKMSQQTSFVTEVIKQEVARVSRLEGKSIQQVLDEVREERQKRAGGEEVPITLRESDITEDTDTGFAQPMGAEETGERLQDFEIEAMRIELLKRELPEHEVEAVISQARELPKEVGEMLLKSFGTAVDMHEAQMNIDLLTDAEIEVLKQQLEREGAGPEEIEQIIEQAREVPKDLAMELFKGYTRETEAKKPPKPTETISEEELENLWKKLHEKGAKEEEIQTILKQAREVPRDVAADFLKEVEEREFLREDKIEFEDRLNEIEIEDLRKELKKRKISAKEIKSIMAQAKNLPKALVKDLLDSIDAEKGE